MAAGFITTLPTGTSSELTSGRWSIGPEILIGKLAKKYVLALLPSHQWNVAGRTDNNVNLTTINPVATYLLGGELKIAQSITQLFGIFPKIDKGYL